MTLEIYLFGAVRVLSLDGNAIRLPTKKSAALLAYLADNHGDPVSRGAVSNLLWPRSAEDQSRASLRQELAVLRKALAPHDPDAITSDGDTIRYANPDAIIDSSALRAIINAPEPAGISTQMQALDLYQKPFLGGLRILSKPFDDWVTQARHHFDAHVLRLGEQALTHWQAEGATAKIIQVARQITAIDPTQEQAHRSLMRAFWAEGHKTLALRQFEICRKALAAKLDIDPSDETKALAEELRESRAPALQATAPRSKAKAQIEERRLVSVLSISAAIPLQDPEDYHDAAKTFRDLAEEIAKASGGQVFRKTEDHLLICFGYPVASEHDADYSVIVANQIMTQMQNDPRLGGTASCGVVRRQAIVKSASPKAMAASRAALISVSGGIDRAASALEQRAGPKTILVDAATAQAVSGAVGLEQADAEGHSFRAHLRPHRILSKRRRSASGNTQGLIGRAAQLGQLTALLAEARGGKDHAIALVGEPGIGKSHLVDELIDVAQTTGVSVHCFYGNPHEQSTALYPLTEHIRLIPGFQAAVKAGNDAAFLTDWFAAISRDLGRASPFFAALMAMEARAAEGALKPPRDQRNLALNCFVDIATKATVKAPLLLVFEDLHWFDPSTLTAVAHLLETAGNRAVLTVLVSRAAEAPDLLKPPLVQRMELGGLSAPDARALITNYRPDVSLPAGWLENVVARAEGIPLVLEEFALALRDDETDSAHTPQTAPPLLSRDLAASAPIAPAAVPPTLEAILLWRLDRIPQAIGHLQKAAILGRQFSLADLIAISDPDQPDPTPALAALEDAGLVQGVLREGQPEYLFKHALFQEVLYATNLKRHRARLHQSAAEAMLTNTADDPKAGRIAAHYDLAQSYDLAAKFYEQAGDQSVHLSAHREAIQQFSKALAMLAQMPASEPRLRRELTLTRKTGSQMISIRGIPTADVETIYQQASDLSDRLGDPEELANTAWGMWGVFLVAGNLKRADEVASTLMRYAEATGSDTLRLVAHYTKGATHAYRGNLVQAAQGLETAIAAYNPAMRGEMDLRYGMNIAMTAQSFLCWVQALAGEPEKAKAASQSALTLAAEMKNGFSLAFATLFSATKALFLDHHSEAATLSTKALEICHKEGFTAWTSQAELQRARLDDLRGHAGALPRLQAGLQNYIASGSVLARPYAQVWIAQSLLRHGRPAEALAEMDDLLDFTARSDERYFDSQALWVRHLAMQALAAGDPVALAHAQSYARLAVNLATEQGAWHLALSMTQPETDRRPA